MGEEEPLESQEQVLSTGVSDCVVHVGAAVFYKLLVWGKRDVLDHYQDEKSELNRSEGQGDSEAFNEFWGAWVALIE